MLARLAATKMAYRAHATTRLRRLQHDIFVCQGLSSQRGGKGALAPAVRRRGVLPLGAGGGQRRLVRALPVVRDGRLPRDLPR